MSQNEKNDFHGLARCIENHHQINHPFIIIHNF